MNKSFLRKAAAFLAAVFSALILLCGCGGESPSNESNLPTLVIGVDYYEPFVYRDDNGEFAGLDVELATEVCRHMGFIPKFVHIDWSEKQAYLLRGEIDCVWCCFSITGREEDYSWTLPYMNSRQVVAVRENSAIKKISDLENKRIAVQSTTKPDEIFSGRAGVKMTVPSIKQLNCFPSMSYVFAALNEGYVDAVAGHETILLEHMKSSTMKIRILDEVLLDVQIGAAFLRGTGGDVIEKMNNTFLLLKNNGYFTDLFNSYGLDPDLCVVNYEQNK